MAAVQAAPAFLDKTASTDRAARGIAAAAARGARLAAFGETFIPGYPAWLDACPGSALWDHLPAKRAYARLLENGISIPGPEIDHLCASARRHGIVVVIGVHERVAAGPGRGTLYNTQVIIGSDGTILSRHRKLVPTHAERLVWGPGDGGGLEAVATPIGRVGTLICWEHWMPLARHAMHQSAEQIHVAAWPAVHDIHQLASRHYAFEGRCFVLAVGQLLRAGDMPKGLGRPVGQTRGRPMVRGGSCIFGPDGALLAGPVFDRETILTADLDLRHIDEESMALDVTGHYNRPDLFTFGVRVAGEAGGDGAVRQTPRTARVRRQGRDGTEERAIAPGRVGGGRWRGRRGSNPRPPA